jgi:hypothetical protein
VQSVDAEGDDPGGAHGFTPACAIRASAAVRQSRTWRGRDPCTGAALKTGESRACRAGDASGGGVEHCLSLNLRGGSAAMRNEARCGERSCAASKSDQWRSKTNRLGSRSSQRRRRWKLNEMSGRVETAQGSRGLPPIPRRCGSCPVRRRVRGWARDRAGGLASAGGGVTNDTTPSIGSARFARR